jgi:hypothetical protein
MPITIRELLEPSWWKSDEADPNGAQFYIKPLNSLQYAALQNEIGFNDFDRICITAAGIKTAIDHGLLDWQNVVDINGAPVKCNRANQELMPVDDLKKVAWRIATISRLDNEQKKSSASPTT